MAYGSVKRSLGRRRGVRKKAPGAALILIGFAALILVCTICFYIGAGFYTSLLGHERKRIAADARQDNFGGLRKWTRTSQFGIFPPNYPVVDRSHNLGEDSLAMCERALWHTLETTTIVLPAGDTFIHTGDIDDLWLRDSAAQVHPLLVPFGDGGGSLVESDPRLARVISGLIQRTAMYIRHDPYANAFRIDDSYVFSAEQKRLGRHDLISTWNYELDSACYYIRMIYYFYKSLPDHPVLKNPRVIEAIDIMVDVWISEQEHESDKYPTGPLFDCKNCGKPYRYPGLARGGKGTEVGKVGMTWSGFRPSDDACRYGYLVPANMFAVVALSYVEELAQTLWNNDDLFAKARSLRLAIDQGINEHAIVDHPKYGKIYAYEVNGLGDYLLMDDANVPSLMSIPYIGYNYIPEIYANTRRFILSTDNPTYQKGHYIETGDIEGYGSPHMSLAVDKNIWPMSLAVQALSSDDVDEKLRLVQKLTKATGGTGWMHESFDVSNPRKYTRSWFCWADSLYAELVMSLAKDCPSGKYHVMKWKDPNTVTGGKYAA
mmetsp:Transcript_21669/g.32821  ORF Transcript_21669/g.32821 Transcript_21669/m.32821 type:complete len:546 (-) Transcript_21669:784-2421(-)